MRPMRIAQVLGGVAAAAALAGCASSPGTTMLVFGQTTTIGIAVGGSVTDQGATFSLGYQDRNFAVVPATVQQADGGATQVRSIASGEGQQTSEDALSVLGQFDVQSSADGAGRVDIGLGKFFATGLAAKVLADGFSARIAASAAAPASAASAAR